jgi:hypothetical protein
MLRAEWTSYREGRLGFLRLSVRRMSYARRKIMQTAPAFKALRKEVLQSPRTRLMSQLNIYLCPLGLLTSQVTDEEELAGPVGS